MANSQDRSHSTSRTLRHWFGSDLFPCFGSSNPGEAMPGAQASHSSFRGTKAFPSPRLAWCSGRIHSINYPIGCAEKPLPTSMRRSGTPIALNPRRGCPPPRRLFPQRKRLSHLFCVVVSGLFDCFSSTGSFSDKRAAGGAVFILLGQAGGSPCCSTRMISVSPEGLKISSVSHQGPRASDQTNGLARQSDELPDGQIRKLLLVGAATWLESRL